MKRQNNIIKGLILIVIILILFNLLFNNRMNKLQQINTEINIDNKIKIDSIIDLKIVLDSIIIKYDSLDSLYIAKRVDLRRYLKAMSFKESTYNQWEENRYGMLGLYQFNNNTLKMLGFNFTKYEFLSSIEKQDAAMIEYMKFNKKVLSKYIVEYAGTTHDSVYITASGILAGAHLMGPGGIIEFFDNDGKYSMVDGNNVHIKSYIEEFSGYEILSAL